MRSNGYKMLSLPLDVPGGSDEIHPVLLWDEETAVLIDTGTPGMSKQIISAIEESGVPFSRVKFIILTHQDIDHIGSLDEMIRQARADLEVFAHELDKPYIEGKLPLLKLNLESMAWQLAGLPEEEQLILVSHLQENPPRGRVDHALKDGQELPFCGGIQVIHTPGHTPGHISLYLKRYKTLIMGDSSYSIDGVIQGPHSHSTPDMQTAVRSLEKCLEYELEAAICYHGGLCIGDIHNQIRQSVQPI